MGFFQLQLLLLISFFSLNSWGADPVWHNNTKEPGSHMIVASKDYYENKYAFDTKKNCVGKCIAPKTQVNCSRYSYVNANPRTQYQFCHIETLKLENGDIQGTNKTLTMVTGYAQLDDNGKVKRFTNSVPANTSFEADLNNKVTSIPESKSEAGVCKDCEPEEGPITQTARAVSEIAKQAPKSGGPIRTTIGNAMKLEVEGKKRPTFSKACYNFIKPDGSLGAWGTEAISTFKNVCKDCFFGSKSVDVSGVCPKFKNFDQTTKEYFWAWTLASMSQDESTCGENPINRNGTNGTAIGLFQLEQACTLRRNKGRVTANKRSSECHVPGELDGNNRCKTDSATAKRIFIVTKSPSFQFKCAASIIRDTRWEKGLSFTGSRGQYWHKLFTNNTKISSHIKMFPGCK